MLLKDKVAVITGGSKGIGKAIAVKMAEEGAKAIILDLDEKAGEKTVDEIREKGNAASFYKCDITDYYTIKKCRDEIIKSFGTIDILVVNAGISYKRTIKDITPEEWQKVINVNLSGSFYTVKAFYDDFLNKSLEDGGKIIFITSGSAITGTGGGAHYSSSKAGQHGLMRAVSKELASSGVNVNAIAPRVIVTEILDELYPEGPKRDELVKKIPIGRLGYPEDIANLACFLASSQASYIHGQIMLVDGGRTY